MGPQTAVARGGSPPGRCARGGWTGDADRSTSIAGDARGGWLATCAGGVGTATPTTGHGRVTKKRRWAVAVLVVVAMMGAAAVLYLKASGHAPGEVDERV